MDAVGTVILEDEAATRALAARIAAALGGGDLVLLEGELGAGKTFLARALCRALGVPDDVAITSPTFGLVHEYEGRLESGGTGSDPGEPLAIVHADLYRLGGPEELVEIGLAEAIEDDRGIVLVEWGERFLTDLGHPTLIVRMKIVGETAREVRIESDDPRVSGLLSDV